MTTTRRAAVLLAAAAVGLGGLAVAAPAMAGAGPSGQPTAAASGPGSGWPGGSGTGPGSGMGPGNGMGPGSGMGPGDGMGPGNGMGMGRTARDGSCAAASAAQGTLTDQQKTTLAAMAQEEKLAHDLYAAFAAKYPAVVFDRIAAAETRHLTAVRTLLDRYGLADPTAGLPAGAFSDAAVQARYAKLLAEGRADQSAALQVGQQVEKADIAELRAALTGLTAADVRQVYTHLLTASQHHLIAFQTWSR